MHCMDPQLYEAAVKAAVEEIVVEILETCTSPAYEGPDQMTALHAAAINCYTPGIIKKILEKNESLIKQIDQYGWTPLHYAAYHRNSEGMKELLECDISAAYIGDNHRKLTPFRVAIGQCYIPYVLLSRCPDSCDLVDERRWNVLHFAILSFTLQDLKILLKKYPLIKNLINDKDVDGNTPLHFLVTCRPSLLWKIKQAYKDIFLDTEVVNNQNMSVFGVVKSGSRQLEQELLKLKESVGPYQYGVVKDEGTAILSKKAAFQAFVITDAIAMVLSLSAVFAHFLMSFPFGTNTETSWSLMAYGATSTMIAMVAMVIAFVTGTYAVLTTSLWLAILTAFIGLSFFLLMYLICRIMASAKKDG
ncbi:hypothetical protein Dsin_029760 [Dipteronia sinensis]|uniref:PGG domain-containing protein n=1 Tax=Dipteronia sinensis TaxID=43782 RepID=A0AAD9ZTP6_9ROSI|nr:hypothetical protein Dsin_029760 [Dipteronia sinensis]